MNNALTKILYTEKFDIVLVYIPGSAPSFSDHPDLADGGCPPEILYSEMCITDDVGVTVRYGQLDTELRTEIDALVEAEFAY